MKIYNLEDYNQIIFDGFCYNLPDSVSSIISLLTKEVETFAPNTTSYAPNGDSKRPQQGSGFNKKPRMKKNDSFDDWNAVRSFKTTIIEKKEGAEKIITDVRSCLNKISTKNYDTQKEQIVILTRELIEQKEEDIFKISSSIFEVASNNKFNSEIFANLYKDLLPDFPQLGDSFDSFIESYSNNINEIHYVDPNGDYDKYCAYNKSNDKRKAITTFITNLVKNGVFNETRAFLIINYMQNKIQEYVDIDDKTNEVDEITENVYLFITLLNTTFKCNEEWISILENVKEFAKLKSKDKKSLSSRAVFKYMDILDTISK
jgi:hypothetical protein